MDSDNYALLSTAKKELIYNENKRENVIKSLLSGETHLFYGPAGTGKTHEAINIVREIRSRGYKALIVAISNEAADRFGGKGMYNTFGWSVDRITGKPRSKLDDLCMACRRSNPQREKDSKWDNNLPTKGELDDYKYMKTYTLRSSDISLMSDLEIISRINARTARFKQLDCAEALQRIQYDVVLIEEAFMVSASLYRLLDEQLRKYRACDKPFGGMGVILSGDALQLEPVKQFYFFQSDIWNIILPQIHLFGTLHRFDSGDKKYLDFLRSARYGQITDEHHEMLLSRRKSQVNCNTGYALCRTREEAYNRNKIEFDKLKNTTRYVVSAIDEYYRHKSFLDVDNKEILPDYLLPEAKRVLDNVERNTELLDRTRVAVGARVIITHNFRNIEIYNGFVGTVTNVHYVAYDSKLATLYGKQGFISSVDILFDRIFTHDVNSVDEESSLSVNTSVKLKGEYNEGRICNVISINGSTFQSRDTVCIRKTSVDYKKGLYSLTRIQFPFTLGWASTIHKAQGNTIESSSTLILSGKMSAGQAYVGCSRVRRLDDLVIEDDYNRNVFYANKAAIDFDRQIQETGKWIVDKPDIAGVDEIEEETAGIDEQTESDDALRAFLMS